MTTAPLALDDDALMRAVRALPGVARADLAPDSDDEDAPGFLRLDLEPGIDEVSVATSVGMLLRERFGLGVDAAGVQLVEEVVAAFRSVGPDVSRLAVVSAGRSVTVAVELALGDRCGAGEGSGKATAAGTYLAVAEATLRAAEALSEGGLEADIDSVDVVDGEVLVQLSVDPDGAVRVKRGRAPVHEDVRQAVARAVLSAVADLL